MTVGDSKVVSPIGMSCPSRTVASDIFAFPSSIKGDLKTNRISFKSVTISAGWGVEFSLSTVVCAAACEEMLSKTAAISVKTRNGFLKFILRIT
jgi:hypothetical protein